MIKLFKLRRLSKSLASLMVVSILGEVVSPTAAYALTGGPSQPEVQSFEPVGTSEMVDVFSGDFNYNIPLMDVGGYPINIAYHGGVTMDQEASWVGLGWNLNPGVINRNMRGIPDDFDGNKGDKSDKISKEMNIKPNETSGGSVDINAEFFGFPVGTPSLGVNFGIIYNNYRGWSHEVGMNPSISIGDNFKTRLGAGFTFNSASGLDLNANLSFSFQLNTKDNWQECNTISGGFNIGGGINSRSGLKTMNMGWNAQVSKYHRLEEKSENVGVGGSSSYNFGTQTYTTRMTMPMINSGYTINFTLGFDAIGLHPNTRFSGYHSKSELLNNSFSLGAFGYLNEQNKVDDNALLDFNREQDHGLHDRTTNLPVTNHTFDIFSVAGQGVGGSYRAFRGDIGVVHDHYLDYSNTGNVSPGLELGLGNIVHKGADIYATFNRVKTGYWKPEDANDTREGLHYGQWLSKKFNFTGLGSSPTYEAYYFKPAGEMSVADETFMGLLKGNRAVKPYIASGSDVLDGTIYVEREQINSKKFLEPFTYMPKNSYIQNTRQVRDKRNRTMSILNERERYEYGLDKYIKTYTLNSKMIDGSLQSSIAGSTFRKEHHISEITILNDDGSRYIYGIPAYNNSQIEKTFNVSGNSISCADGQTAYNTGTNPDNTMANNRGDDHYYTKTEVPGYAHSYLLTGVVSPDYVDVTNNGISDDDFGTAVKFNYTRTRSNYQWRIPYNSNSANFQEGMKTKTGDDMGSYVYGTKEIWHLHSIESKNHIAFFIISTREDGLGVSGENGGKNTSARSYKLDRIELFNKNDYRENGSNAEPIKVVYFEYDYSLCPEVENNTGAAVAGNTNHGKLTLKKIYFSYGKSNKGKFSPYKFVYSDVNPSYNLKGNDVWGNYKPNNDGGCLLQYDPNLSPSELTTLSNSNPTNAEFPYSLQDKDDADEYSSAWSLTEVYLPSGGKINIEYEADDYAYVQDKNAMQMFKISAFGYKDGSSIVSLGNLLYNKEHQGDVIIFDLDSSISTGSGASAELKRQYLEGIKDLQVTVLADVDGDNHFEYVKCYIELDANIGYGVLSGGTQGWIGIKKVGFGDKRQSTNNLTVNPVSKAIWNFARINADHLVNPEGYKQSLNDFDSKKAKAKMPALIKEFANLFKGFNFTLYQRGFGQKVILKRSWVRLNVPDKIKYGGGHRVKKLYISDNWSEMGASNTGATDSKFGQEYDYKTTEKGSDNVTRIISSGVCTYEPATGGDDNPFKVPRTISVENKLVPDEFYQLEEPMGESFFPGASVGYSKVTVRNLGRNPVKRTGTGKEVSEFYTYKDFPVIVKETGISIEKIEPNKFLSMFSLKHTTKITASQGYTIELNDMHGKPKSKFSYAEGADKPYSGIKYVYKTDPDNPKKVFNTVSVVNPQGVISNKTIGVDFDVVHDLNQHFDRTTNTGLSVNGETFYIVIATIKVPVIIPKFKKITTQVRTAVTTKIINRYGVLDKTIAFQEGASIETQNLLWDSETGQVLLTSVQNEFRDSVYNFTYPAHWSYEGMGAAYRNIGFGSDARIINKEIVLSNGLDADDYLVPGDECLIGNYSRVDDKNIYIDVYANLRKAYVYKGSDGKLNLINENGVPIGFDTDNTLYRLKVVRSGRRNLQSTPVGTVTLLKNPIRGTGNNRYLVFEEILNAEAMEYSDQWQTYLEYSKEYPCDTLFTQDALDYMHLLDDMVDSGAFDKKYNINTNLILYNDSASCLAWSDTVNFQLLNKVAGTYYTIGYTNTFTPQDTCGKEFYGQIGDTSNRYRIYNGKEYFYNECGYFVTKYVQSNAVLYNLSNSPWFDTTNLNEMLDSCAIEVPEWMKIEYLSDGTSQISRGGFCCKTKFGISAPYTNVLKFYNYRANGDSTFEASAIILNEFCEVDTVKAYFGPTCFKVIDCDYQCRNVLVRKHINPYRANMEGVWRPIRNHKYLDERNYASNPDPRHDGTYKSFNEFWQYDAGFGKFTPDTSNEKWVWASEVTKYSPFGPEIENKDALNRYSAALYGYNYTHPIAVASNSRYTEIAYDGFEDYNYYVFGGEDLCASRHFNFRDQLSEDVSLDNSIKHTGMYSLKVNAGASAMFTTSLLTPTTTTNTRFNTDVTKITDYSDDLGTFTPDSGKYLLGVWVKTGVKQGDTTYYVPNVKVTITDASNVDHVTTYRASGNIIEGWQRIEGVFEVPAGAKNIKIELIGDESNDVWFDDIRVHPYDGNMASYVYDNRTLRLMAELDANNFATFYEYDLEGGLIRQKKETINGIVTLKEVRNSTIKRPSTTILK